ncbi:hypothetical protein EYF80_033315 [Liparis tanakae]|uniref:Uncharacterized protein n=1 Tax=Liparis tanakae TaxID=230148 RepID=A0A4Z2GTK8_9TELE|nr:hypothetical protein EYF80_033315 [Liparis tanakae]
MKKAAAGLVARRPRGTPPSWHAALADGPNTISRGDLKFDGDVEENESRLRDAGRRFAAKDTERVKTEGRRVPPRGSVTPPLGPSTLCTEAGGRPRVDQSQRGRGAPGQRQTGRPALDSKTCLCQAAAGNYSRLTCVNDTGRVTAQRKRCGRASSGSARIEREGKERRQISRQRSSRRRMNGAERVCRPCRSLPPLTAASGSPNMMLTLLLLLGVLVCRGQGRDALGTPLHPSVLSWVDFVDKLSVSS